MARRTKKPARSRSPKSSGATSSAQSSLIDVDTALLVGWQLPDPDEASDKDERGRALLIGGSSEMPGAIVLAGMAAMRAGAGKLCIATAASVAQLVAQAIPEARVVPLSETPRGGLRPRDLSALPAQVDAVLVGPGMQDEKASVQLTRAVLHRYPDAKLVLDTLAMSVVQASIAIEPRGASIVITPHPGEMAHLTGQDKQHIAADLQLAAREAARRWQVIVALKSSTTFIAHPDQRVWRHTGGNSGLAISGSGDVLAGIVAGLCARGASVEQATAWGVALHARGGEALARRIGPIGFLAREIPDEVPAILRSLCA